MTSVTLLITSGGEVEVGLVAFVVVVVEAVVGLVVVVVVVIGVVNFFSGDFVVSGFLVGGFVAFVLGD